MANLKYIGKNILNHDLILKKGDVSGSNASTGSFGNLSISNNASVTGDMVVGGKLTAQEIHTEIESASIIFTSGSTKFGDTSDDTHEFTGSILVKGDLTAENLTADSSSFSTRVTNLKTDSGSFSTRITADSSSFSTRVTNLKTDSGSFSTRITADSSSFSTRVTDLKTDSGSFSTRVTDLKTDSGSFSTRVTRNEGTGSKILNGQLEFTNITASGNITADGNISGSSTSTGSFGRVETADDMNVGDDLTVSGIAGIGGAPISGNTLTVNGTDNVLRLRHTGAPNSANKVNIDFSTNNAGTRNMYIETNQNASNGNSMMTIGGYFFAAVSGYADILQIGAPLSGNTNTLVISGSVRTTGSFGRLEAASGVEAEHIHSTDDISAADDITAGGRLVAETDAKIANIITLDVNGISVGGDTRYIRVGSDSDFEINHRHPQHTSPFRASTNTNILTDKTNSGLLLFGGNPGIIMESAVSASEGMFLSGSRANIELRGGNISGSSTSTGSFGLVLQNGSELSTFLGAAGTETLFSGSLVSTGSFGRLEATDMDIRGTGSFDKLTVGPRSATLQNYSGMKAQLTIEAAQDSALDRAIYIKQTPDDFGYVINTNGSVTGDFSLHNVAGGTEKTNPAISTGQDQKVGIGTFTRPEKLSVGGNIHSTGIVTASSFTGIFNGALSSSAQIASNISGAFAVASASFAADILSNSSSFAARDTLSEATSSKILNGELEFTNITGSGHVSMSLSSTGSFGRVSATTIGGHSPLTVDSNTTFTNSITSSAHVSSSMTSTASFGRVNVVALGGHQSLTIDPITTFTNVITASAKVQLDGQVFIQSGSIEGDLHVRTNENLMRIGKSTSGLIVSGSEEVSRFATGSDGSIIDLGFTVTDEDGNVVLAGDGDGIHIDGNNYWYNNKYYKVGDGVNNFLNYDALTLKYKGEVIAQTGSFGGEMFINSPTGSMFIGKFTGGIPSSGSDNVSRFATGSDGSIIDLGFTTTNEEGETVFLTTGDGIVRDDKNYWYTTGHFKIGNSYNFINWDTSNLTISGTFTGDGSGLTGVSSFNGSAGTETLFSGSAASTGSFGIIENNTQIAGFRPIINQTGDFSASLSNAGRYHIVHGNLTCSIGTDASMPVTIGAEYEFFQSSSVGNFLFQTGSGVSLLSKNNNRNIAGQHSGATLKKVASNTFHLVGDLT